MESGCSEVFELRNKKLFFNSKLTLASNVKQITTAANCASNIRTIAAIN